MIFRKPYAFLIKYFKLINLLLAVLAIYIAYRTYSIISFFNEYITNNYTGNYYEGFSSAYINPFVYLILGILLFGLLGIFLLFKYKKKPAKIYIFSIIYYIVFIVFLYFIKDVMITIESTVITAETSRLYRDLSVISLMPQIPLIIAYVMRGLGFNIKRFNFDADLKELEIEETDNEEVEITLKSDDVKLRRNINRFIREFTYYVKENKFIFSIICLGLIILLAFLIYRAFPEIIDRDYNQGEMFVVGNINYKLEDSIITNLDYKGDIIDEDSYYVVIKLYIENNTTKEATLDYNNFRLIINDNYVYPTKDQGRYFIDYAVDYYSNVIKANSKGIYSLVYKIDEKDLKKNYEIKVDNGQAVSDNILVGRHNYINIVPIVINKVNKGGEANLGEELKLSDSNLGNTVLKLSNEVFTTRYIYDYEYCINTNCNTYKDIISVDYTKNDKTLLILDYTYEIDNTVPYYTYSSNVHTFIKSFAKIKYVKDKTSVYKEVKNVTPNNLKNKIVLEVTNEVLESEEIDLTLTIRNKEYTIKIK